MQIGFFRLNKCAWIIINRADIKPDERVYTMNANQVEQSKFRIIYIFSLLIALILTGCGSIQIGRDFNVTSFENMAKVGETSKAQVREVLGPPKSLGLSINRDGERLEEWVYFYATGKVSAMEDAGLKILQIRFQQNGKLRSYNWSNSDK